jgi:hypothetical protein
MYRQQFKRNPGLLWALIVLAAIYDGLLYLRHALTGALKLDASLGVLLGLFICSRGAANLLDIILFGRIMQSQAASKRGQAWWVALNVLVLVMGWSVVVIGVIQFARASATNIVPIGPRR